MTPSTFARDLFRNLLAKLLSDMGGELRTQAWRMRFKMNLKVSVALTDASHVVGNSINWLPRRVKIGPTAIRQTWNEARDELKH